MTLERFYRNLISVISRNDYIKEVIREDIYKLNGDSNTLYAVAGYSTVSVDYDDNFTTLQFQLYVIDRLTESRSNYASIISTAIETSNLILLELANDYEDIIISNRSYVPINADFAFKDICCGTVGTITVQFPNNTKCFDGEFEQTIFEQTTLKIL